MYTLTSKPEQELNVPNLWPLTEKEQEILRYLEHCMREEGVAPTYRQVQEHFGFKSINSIQKYFRQLEEKGYVRQQQNKRRSVVILQSSDALQKRYKAAPQPPTPAKEGPLKLPLLGRVAAGLPLERLIHDEQMEVPRHLVRRPESSFILQVEGESMVEDGIFDGDFLIIQEQSLAANGQIVVAVVNQEATVKRFYLHNPKDLKRRSQEITKPIELRPSNHTMSSFWYAPEQVEIRGVVVGLIRRF